MELLIILSLVCWRITYALVEQTGPLNIFTALRKKVYNSPLSPLHCFLCTTIWVAFPLSLLYSNWLIGMFAISALAIFINTVWERVDR
jgi:hypothetical protein